LAHILSLHLKRSLVKQYCGDAINRIGANSGGWSNLVESTRPQARIGATIEHHPLLFGAHQGSRTLVGGRLRTAITGVNVFCACFSVRNTI
jgi:hypothetical protein